MLDELKDLVEKNLFTEVFNCSAEDAACLYDLPINPAGRNENDYEEKNNV